MSDIPSPYDVPLPEKNFISEKDKEEIRDLYLLLKNFYLKYYLSIFKIYYHLLPIIDLLQKITLIYDNII